MFLRVHAMHTSSVFRRDWSNTHLFKANLPPCGVLNEPGPSFRVHRLRRVVSVQEELRDCQVVGYARKARTRRIEFRHSSDLQAEKLVV